MTTARPDSRLGTDLGPYRIERVLGRGGMGVVYLAEQRELGRKVALKLLPDELAQDADFRARFERESRLAAAIDHPNVIPLYEAGEVDGVLFLAMRYVDGTDLASRLRAGPLPSATAIELLAQVAGALDAAHAKGLVHRDVKPGNVLLDRTGNDERPHAYLTDFGLTKQAGSDSGLTRAGAFLGTPAYMAPEQVDGTEVDGRADQYALGAMAFECLTGRVPFVRDKEVAVALAHLKDPVPSAVALQPGLPAPIDVVLAKVMAKDREARYPSCAAFVDDLRTALGGGAVVARPIRLNRRRRPLVLVGAVAGLGLVAVAGLALASGLLGGSPAAPTAPSQSGSAPLAIASATASPTATSSAFPNTAEEALLARLPTAMVGHCERGSYASVEGGGSVSTTYVRPLAEVRCDISDASGEATVWFQAFPRTAGNERDFTVGRAALISLEHVNQHPKAGDCRERAAGVGTWASGDIGQGQLVCYQHAGASWIYWSYDTASILAHATRPDGDWRSLMSWWESAARFVNAQP